MTQELNTKATGFEERVAEIHKIDDSISDNSDYRDHTAFWEALNLVDDMQTALVAKDAEIVDLNAARDSHFNQAMLNGEEANAAKAEIAELRGLLVDVKKTLEFYSDQRNVCIVKSTFEQYQPSVYRQMGLDDGAKAQSALAKLTDALTPTSMSLSNQSEG